MKTETPSFVVQLRLVPSPSDRKALCKALDAGRLLYNACLGEALKQLKLMRESKAYRKALSMPKGKKRTEAFREIRSQYGFKDSSIQAFAVKIKNDCHIGDHMDVHTAQKVATRAFAAANRYALGKGGRPRFKGKAQFSSLESKTNASGIKYRNGRIEWQGMKIQCIIDPKDEVVAHGLSKRIKYCRIVRRRINGTNKYYAQLIIEGYPHRKDKHVIGQEIVGIDIGPSTIAYVGETKAGLKQFCEEIQPLGKRIKLLQRAMDRSRRATNPDNYNHDGTPKKGKRKWVYSTRYQWLKAKLSELQRVRAEYRKSLHGKLANEILSVGNQLRIEKNSYRSFQRNYGKSIGNRAPGMFVSLLIRKAESAGGDAWHIPARELKLSQLCACGRLRKKKLSERVHICECGVVAQRDMLSAFLAKCTEKDDGKYILDTSRAATLWREAEPLLGQAVSRILEQFASGTAMPASFGVASLLRRQSESSVKLMSGRKPETRTAAKVGDVVAACSYRCCESPEEVAVTMSRTPCL